MRVKKFFLLPLLIALIVLGVAIATRWRFETKAQAPTAPEGSIRWSAQQALSQGQDHLEVVSQLAYKVPADLNQAISTASLFVGQITGTATSWDQTTGEITTWYKLDISEILGQKAFAACAYCTTIDAPSELLPISSSQLVVRVPGGQALIDDVIVQETLAGFPGFVQSQRYLLFLNFDSNTRVGEFEFGPAGAFLINTDNTLSHVLELTEGQSDPISAGLEAQYSNSLTNLRAALQPSNCNPAQQQDCVDSGGTWSSTNCTCQPALDPCVKKPWLCP
jgi:hypothetical protein